MSTILFYVMRCAVNNCINQRKKIMQRVAQARGKSVAAGGICRAGLSIQPVCCVFIVSVLHRFSAKFFNFSDFYGVCNFSFLRTSGIHIYIRLVIADNTYIMNM